MDWLERLLGRKASPEQKRAEALNRSAIKHIAVEQFGDAEKLLLEAVTLMPDTAAYHHNLGAAYMGQSRYVQAMKEMRRACRLDPGDLETRVAVAKIQAHMGKHAESIAEYRKLCREAPDDWRSHAALGNALIEQGQTDQAIVHLERAAQIKPREELVHMVLAVAYEQRGDLAKAVAAYEAVRKVSRIRQNRRIAEEKARQLRLRQPQR